MTSYIWTILSGTSSAKEVDPSGIARSRHERNTKGTERRVAMRVADIAVLEMHGHFAADV